MGFRCKSSGSVESRNRAADPGSGGTGADPEAQKEGESVSMSAHSIFIRPEEIHLEFVRASGPGGQNVNKVATAVQLRFDARNSQSIGPDVRERLILLAGKRANS